MLYSIGRTNPNNTKVIVYDAWSKLAASGNTIKQGGYENTEYYSNVEKVEFGNIDNIHAVRYSYKKTS